MDPKNQHLLLMPDIIMAIQMLVEQAINMMAVDQEMLKYLLNFQMDRTNLSTLQTTCCFS